MYPGKASAFHFPGHLSKFRDIRSSIMMKVLYLNIKESVNPEAGGLRDVNHTLLRCMCNKCSHCYKFLYASYSIFQ